MRVRDLESARLAHELRTVGLKIRTGPVVNCIRSPLASVAEGIALHYAAHPLEPADAFADFHVCVERPFTHRRWFEPQALFRFDGALPFTPLPLHQALPLLEWGLNWCMSTQYYRFLSFHSAVVEKNGLALVLPAPSGSGKSTLCTALAFRGWRLLSDEMALLDPATGLLQGLPRPISLKNRSIATIAAFAPEAVFSPTVPDTLKGSVAHLRPPQDAVDRAGVQVRARWIVLPKFEAGAPAVLEPMPRAEAFMAMLEHCFNFNAFAREGFATLAGLVGGCDAYRFRYGVLDEAVALFDRLAEEAAAAPSAAEALG